MHVYIFLLIRLTTLAAKVILRPLSDIYYIPMYRQYYNL